uniref:Transmembrane protein n=1 Tax=Steinernema glaseri TaxID=37863 RepID=A0A1I8A4M0_9BILA
MRLCAFAIIRDHLLALNLVIIITIRVGLRLDSTSTRTSSTFWSRVEVEVEVRVRVRVENLESNANPNHDHSYSNIRLTLRRSVTMSVAPSTSLPRWKIMRKEINSRVVWWSLAISKLLLLNIALFTIYSVIRVIVLYKDTSKPC